MRSWFVDKLGVDTGSLGDAEALKFGGIWLLVDSADRSHARAAGRPSTISGSGRRTSGPRSATCKRTT